MKQSSFAKCPILVVLSICSFALPGLAEEFPLTYTVLPQTAASIGSGIKTTDKGPDLQPPRGLQKIPKFRSQQPLFDSVTLNKQVFALAFDESKGTGKGYDVVIADANGNGDLTDDAPQSMAHDEHGSRFHALPLKLNFEGESVPYAISGQLWPTLTEGGQGQPPVKGWGFQAFHSGVWKGKVRLGEHLIDVAVYDADSNGRYDSAPRPAQDTQEAPDLLLLDWDNNGKLDLSWGLMPIHANKLVASNGEFFELHLHPSGQRINVKPVAIPMGTIRFNYPHVRLQLMSDTASLVLDTKDGKIKVPSGNYPTQTWRIETIDKDGNHWEIEASEKQSLIVTENTDIDLSLATSLTARVEVNKMIGVPPELTTRITTASSGILYMLKRNGEKFIPPIKVLDSEGNTVSRLQFPHKFGPNFPEHWWEPPADAKGKTLTAVPEMDALPFKVEVQPSVEFQL